MKDESISDADIYSAASEPARDDQGRFAPSEAAPTDTQPAIQETPTPNLGQLPDQGEAREPEAGQDQGQGQPQAQEAPHQDPRMRGVMSDLQGERKRRQQYESDLAAR